MSVDSSLPQQTPPGDRLVIGPPGGTPLGRSLAHERVDLAVGGGHRGLPNIGLVVESTGRGRQLAVARQGAMLDGVLVTVEVDDFFTRRDVEQRAVQPPLGLHAAARNQQLP